MYGKRSELLSPGWRIKKITKSDIKGPEISKIHQECPPLFGSPYNRKYNKQKR